MDGLPEDPSGQIPQGEINGRQHAVGEGAQIQPLPLLQGVPDALAIERVLADQHWRDDVLDRASLDGAEVRTARTIVGFYRQERLHSILLGPWMSMTLRVSDDLRAVVKLLDIDRDDLHAQPSRSTSGYGGAQSYNG